MNEPQVWTMVIGTLAVFFTLVGLVSTWFTRLMTAQFDAMNARFDGLEATIEAKFETVDVKLAHLDRDVQALTKHVFRQPE